MRFLIWSVHNMVWAVGEFSMKKKGNIELYYT